MNSLAAHISERSNIFTLDEVVAVITFLSPGLRFFHQGQFQGRQKRLSPHLVRGPDEPIDQQLEQFYGQLLAVLVDGRILTAVPAFPVAVFPVAAAGQVETAPVR